MNSIHDPIGYQKPAPTTCLVAMKIGYSKRSDIITWCNDAIPELMGDRTEKIAHDYVTKWHSGKEYVLINSRAWEALPA